MTNQSFADKIRKQENERDSTAQITSSLLQSRNGSLRINYSRGLESLEYHGFGKYTSRSHWGTRVETVDLFYHPRKEEPFLKGCVSLVDHFYPSRWESKEFKKPILKTDVNLSLYNVGYLENVTDALYFQKQIRLFLASEKVADSMTHLMKPLSRIPKGEGVNLLKISRYSREPTTYNVKYIPKYNPKEGESTKGRGKPKLLVERENKTFGTDQIEQELISPSRKEIAELMRELSYECAEYNRERIPEAAGYHLDLDKQIELLDNLSRQISDRRKSKWPIKSINKR